MRRTNAYHRPEWRALVARVRKRSRGICEAKVCCGGAPVHGDPHHLEYAPFWGWRRLIVELEHLIDCCRDCHLWFEEQKRLGRPILAGGTSLLEVE